MFWIMPTGFLPNDDLGFLFTTTEAQQGVSFEEMKVHQQALAKVIGEDPAVRAYMSTASGGNGGGIFLVLTRGEERHPPARVILRVDENFARDTGLAGAGDAA